MLKVRRCAPPRIRGLTALTTPPRRVHGIYRRLTPGVPGLAPPFRIYDQRQPSELLILRVYHQTRRPIMR